MSTRALITGVSGQTGSYLAEYLLSLGYTVYGLVRRSSNGLTPRLASLSAVTLLEGDLADSASLQRALLASKPHEVYHLAAQSQVGVSFTEAEYTADVTGVGTLRLLEAIRLYTPLTERIRIYFAGSNEQYGNLTGLPYTERTAMNPCSPYGAAKKFAYDICQTYRQAYGMYIACGIACNHESPRRGDQFVTRKITKGIANILTGHQEIIRLGNLSAKRDFIHAQDLVRGAWQTLQQPFSDNYVFASGVSYSIQEFAEYACNYAGLDYQQVIRTDPSLRRPTDIADLYGLSEKAAACFGWRPTITFQELIREMVDHDLADARSRHPLAPVGRPASDPVPAIDSGAGLSA